MPCLNCTHSGHVCERKAGLFCASKTKNRRSESRKIASSAVVKNTSQGRSQVTYLSAPSSSEPDPDSTTETEYKIESEAGAASPRVKSPKVKKEHKVKEPKAPKQRISNALTYRGDPGCVWIERPHPQAHKPICTGAPEVWCTVCIVCCSADCMEANKMNRTAKSYVRAFHILEAIRVALITPVVLCVDTLQMAVPGLVIS